MRPVVKTALRRLWRDPTTLQIGVHPERAFVLGGVGGRAADLIAALDGTRDAGELRVIARGLGLGAGVVDRLIAMLASAAVIDDASVDSAALADLRHDERDRLAPDLASISVTSQRLDAGVSSMVRRQRSRVAVLGAGRVGGAIATLLAAAGVGQIVVDDPAPCRPRDCGPAGAALADTGSTRGQAARAAIHRVSRGTRTTAPAPGERLDFVILAPGGGVSPLVVDELLRSGTAHLLAAVRETTGVVGPLVVPGTSACLRCLDLHRTDRDPAWPLLAAQLATESRRSTVEACDVVLATMTASVAAMQALAWLDADPDGDPATRRAPVATLDGTLELTLPDWRLRRRSWSPHPSCGCHWPAGADDAYAAPAVAQARVTPTIEGSDPGQ